MNPTNLLVPPKLQVWVLSSSNTNVKFNVCNTRLSVHTHNGRFGDHLSDILRPVQRNGTPHLDERSDTGPLQKGDGTVNHNLFCLDFIGHMTLLKWRLTMQLISSPTIHILTYLVYVFKISYWWLRLYHLADLMTYWATSTRMLFYLHKH